MKRLSQYLGAGLLLLLLIGIWKLATQDFTKSRDEPIHRHTGLQRPSISQPREAVTFPGLGDISGHYSEQTIDIPYPETSFKPDKLLLDEQGRFLYLRNRPPAYDVKRRIDLIEPLFRKYLAKNLRELPEQELLGPPDSFKILGPAPLDLNVGELKEHLLRSAKSDIDVELWALLIFHPRYGEKEVLLESKVDETCQDKNGNSAVWKYGTDRSVTLSFLNEFGSYESVDWMNIFEEWNVAPPNVEEENHFGFIWEGEILAWDDYLTKQRELGNPEPVLPLTPPPKQLR